MPVLALLMYNMMGSVIAYPMIPDFLVKGSCATISMQPNFKIDKYQGLWWEIFALPGPYKYLPITNCTMQNYTLEGKSSLKVNTTGLNKSGEKVTQVALLSPNQRSSSTEKTGDFMVEAFGVPPAPYQVLATDYKTYSCVYSCMDFMEYKAEFAWVLGRVPHLEIKSTEKCTKALNEYGIGPTMLGKTQQGKMCPYYHHLAEIIHSKENVIFQIFGHKLDSVKLTDNDSVSVIYSSAAAKHIRINFPLTTRDKVFTTKTKLPSFRYPSPIPLHNDNDINQISSSTYSNYLTSVDKFSTNIAFTSLLQSIIPRSINVKTSITHSNKTCLKTSPTVANVTSTPFPIPYLLAIPILLPLAIPIKTTNFTTTHINTNDIVSIETSYITATVTSKIPILLPLAIPIKTANSTTTHINTNDIVSMETSYIAATDTSKFVSSCFRTTYIPIEPTDSSTVSLIQTSTFITTTNITEHMQSAIQFEGNMSLIGDASNLPDLAGSFNSPNLEVTDRKATPITTLVFTDIGIQDHGTSQILPTSYKPVNITLEPTDISITTLIPNITNTIQSEQCKGREIIECSLSVPSQVLPTSNTSNKAIEIIKLLGGVFLLGATITSIYLATILIIDLISNVIFTNAVVAVGSMG